jgi:hypothetical protein
MLETATRGAVRFPRRVQDLLQAALDLRDRHAAGRVSDHGLAVARGRLAKNWRTPSSRPNCAPVIYRVRARTLDGIWHYGMPAGNMR